MSKFQINLGYFDRQNAYFLKLFFHSPVFSRNPDNYSGIFKTRVIKDRIWTPSINLENSLQRGGGGGGICLKHKSSKILNFMKLSQYWTQIERFNKPVLSYNGHVRWLRQFRVKASCIMQVKEKFIHKFTIYNPALLGQPEFDSRHPNRFLRLRFNRLNYLINMIFIYREIWSRKVFSIRWARMSSDFCFARRSNRLCSVRLIIDIWQFLILNINRYRRGLETCSQAKTFKSGREYFIFSDASERRVWLSASLLNASPVSVKS